MMSPATWFHQRAISAITAGRFLRIAGRFEGAIVRDGLSISAAS
jgi:hypothetical protein